jgi:hypothetical protein
VASSRKSGLHGNQPMWRTGGRGSRKLHDLEEPEAIFRKQVGRLCNWGSKARMPLEYQTVSWPARMLAEALQPSMVTKPLSAQALVLYHSRRPGGGACAAWKPNPLSRREPWNGGSTRDSQSGHPDFCDFSPRWMCLIRSLCLDRGSGFEPNE